MRSNEVLGWVRRHPRRGRAAWHPLAGQELNIHDAHQRAATV